jgi:UDP:flavonoid glycosyltransferase YjiC (YdhE family)
MRVITDPAYRDGAARLRMDMLASPSPSELVPTLERLTLGG